MSGGATTRTRGQQPRRLGASGGARRFDLSRVCIDQSEQTRRAGFFHFAGPVFIALSAGQSPMFPVAGAGRVAPKGPATFSPRAVPSSRAAAPTLTAAGRCGFPISRSHARHYPRRACAGVVVAGSDVWSRAGAFSRPELTLMRLHYGAAGRTAVLAIPCGSGVVVAGSAGHARGVKTADSAPLQFVLRRQPGSEPAQDITQLLGCATPSVCGLRHAQQRRRGYAREVGKSRRERGNV